MMNKRVVCVYFKTPYQILSSMRLLFFGGLCGFA